EVAILEHDVTLAVQKPIDEVLLAWEGAQEGELGQPVFTRHAAGGAVFSRVIFRGKPRPMLGIEFGERERLVGQFVADFFAPSAMPAFNDALGLTILDLGVQQMDAEFGADQLERVGDVGCAEIDVVGARNSMLEDGLLEAVLLVDGAFGKGEVAVRNITSRAIDLGEQVSLAQRAIGGDDQGPVQRVALPQISSVLGKEGSQLRESMVLWPGGEAIGMQLEMISGEMISAC